METLQMKKAIVQFYTDYDRVTENRNVHPTDTSLIQMSKSRFQKYAKKHGAEYYFLTERYFPSDLNPMVESLRIPTDDYWQQYDLVLFADVDVVLNREAPNIWELCDVNKLNCVERMTGNNEDYRDLPQMRIAMDGKYADELPPEADKYALNSGVVVFGKGFAEKFRSVTDIYRYDRWRQRDQHELIYCSYKTDSQNPLNWRWNDYRTYAKDSHCWHFKGSRKHTIFPRIKHLL